MPSIITSANTENCLRTYLKTEGYSLNKLRKVGETGVDIIAKKGNETLCIEVIGFKSSGPARSKDFYQVFFRAISRIGKNVTKCVIALPRRFERGLPLRVRQYNEAWRRISKAFPELEIWLIDTDKKKCRRTKWPDWLTKNSRKDIKSRIKT